MKKQSAAGLFFSILLKAIVILLGIAIVAFGIFFIIKVMKTDKTDSNPATTVSDNVLTEAGAHDDLLYETTAATTEAVPEPDNVAAITPSTANILVLNSTDTTGLAGRWCEKFNGYGYANTMASDYSTPQETTRIVAKSEDLGQDFLQYFNGASYEVGEVTEGASIDTSAYDVVIIIGAADDDSQ
ncbi:MAG: LytR C-terminal domain-containing protein [Lachnospiraceae bacterium]|nr:LytR C-terminal domain-containing protein [Lachnospiraceae bacterium]